MITWHAPELVFGMYIEYGRNIQIEDEHRIFIDEKRVKLGFMKHDFVLWQEQLVHVQDIASAAWSKVYSDGIADSM